MVHAVLANKPTTNNMSAICPTCNSKLSCGCQRRTASNGASVCTQCIARYEADLKNTNLQQVQPAIPPHPSAQAIYNNLKK